jgi:preprotein translocase subunit SecG
MLQNILLVANILVCIGLITVVLMQRSEGGALGMGGGPSGFMTARGAGDFLTRTTWILFGTFLALSLALTLLGGGARSVTERMGTQRLDASKLNEQSGLRPSTNSATPAAGAPVTPPTTGTAPPPTVMTPPPVAQQQQTGPRTAVTGFQGFQTPQEAAMQQQRAQQAAAQQAAAQQAAAQQAAAQQAAAQAAARSRAPAPVAVPQVDPAAPTLGTRLPAAQIRGSGAESTPAPAPAAGNDATP